MENHSSQLFHYILRMNKEDSAFFYFQLEASDGLCFYSTLENPPHAQFRDIELRGDIKLKPEMLHLIRTCSQKFRIEILTDEIIYDQKA